MKERPQRKYNWFRRVEGRYDFCHPNEVQAQYLFQFRKDAPKLKRGFVIDMEYDYGWDNRDYTCLELAQGLLEIYETKYLYTSSKDDIKKVIEYLKSCSTQDLIDYAKYRILNATYQMRKCQKERIDAVWDLRDLVQPCGIGFYKGEGK